MAEHKLLQLDLDAILRQRLSARQSKRLPRFATAMLSRIFHVSQLNEMLRYAYPKRGSAFSAALMEYLGNRIEISGEENIEADKRYIFASNHPLGGLDGIAMIKVLGERYGDENIRFLVNDMLMHVEPLADVFLPINKYGSQGRKAAAAINEVYASDKQMLIFPAGLVSRLQPDGTIADLKWHKAFVAKAMDYQRDIVPVKFEALNTNRFYKFARLRKRLGIKVNLEQALLPGELCKARNKRWKVTFGKPIAWEQLSASGTHPAELATTIRGQVYSL